MEDFIVNIFPDTTHPSTIYKFTNTVTVNDINGKPVTIPDQTVNATMDELKAQLLVAQQKVIDIQARIDAATALPVIQPMPIEQIL